MNDDRPLVSIIIPVYNVEEYLRECIDSILNQSYYNLEIIMVDDGSTDDSGNICDAYAKKDSRIHVVHQENGGPSKARNSGLFIKNGQYVMFVDGDDFIYPDCIECLVNCIEETDADIVIGGHVKVKASFEMTDYKEQSGHRKQFYLRKHMKENAGEPKVIDGYQTKIDMLSGHLNMYVHGKLYRADIMQQVDFVENRIFEDVLFLWDMLKKVKRVAILPNILYAYRQRPNSIVNGKYSHARMDQVYVAERIYEEVEKENTGFRRMASSRIFFSAMDNYAMLGEEDKADRQYLYRLIKRHRWNVLKDPQSDLKLKIIALLSCVTIKGTGKGVGLYKKEKAKLFLN